MTEPAGRPASSPRTWHPMVCALLACALCIVSYVSCYVVLSRVGMMHSLAASSGEKVWAFQSITQNLESFLEDTPIYREERLLRRIFLPLVAVDRLFGNIHVLDDPLPDLGG